MQREELARQLVTANEPEQATLLHEYSTPDDVPLAYALKDLSIESWRNEPAHTAVAAVLLRRLAQESGHAEINALAFWAEGLVAISDGQLETAITRLDNAQARFLALGNPHAAAFTQVGKPIALAMLGRYDEAIECGLRARAVFLAHNDLLAAGKIEQNVGNIYLRRDLYAEAEKYFTSARARFLPVEDNEQLAQIENCLGYIHIVKHDFRAAEELYRLALQRAETVRQPVTQAEIEANIGNLALFQGHYNRALDYLERARRKYVTVGVNYLSALVTEQEIADAYLEMNLVPEAAEIYARLLPVMANIGLHWERARALASYGNALVRLQNFAPAHQAMSQAREFYAQEGNLTGAAMVTLAEAQLDYEQGHYAAAQQAAQEAAGPLRHAGAWRSWLAACWLAGETARQQGHTEAAREMLQAALRDAETQEQPHIAHRCHTSLGLIARQAGHDKLAEASFERAVELIENLRAPLPAEMFRAAFLADKLLPYQELARLCADAGRIGEAFCHVESARARALAEQIGAPRPVAAQPADEFETRARQRLEELREELNWFYSSLNRPAMLGAAQLAACQQAAQDRERETLALSRQLAQRRPASANSLQQLDLSGLQETLGDNAALVEYAQWGAEWLAFVVTESGVAVVRDLGADAEIRAALEQFHFQLGTLRHGAQRLRQHLPQLARRAEKHLATLYDLLLRPLEKHLGARRLVIVPHGALHYVPFHALHDGTAYVIEQREVSYAPGAAVFYQCATRKARPLQNVVLCGVPDELTPSLRDEVTTLAQLFTAPVTLLDEQATLDAVRAHAPGADLLHLACHGRFRPDNPLFSSLKLADGWLTVRDATALQLKAELVTLSACETGLNAIAPGEEIIGLARGFLTAGAASLVLSLWTVDDAATAQLMAGFYRRLQAGDAPAQALRAAQIEALQQHPHPFFWSPFVLLGRW